MSSTYFTWFISHWIFCCLCYLFIPPVSTSTKCPHVCVHKHVCARLLCVAQGRAKQKMTTFQRQENKVPLNKEVNCSIPSVTGNLCLHLSLSWRWISPLFMRGWRGWHMLTKYKPRAHLVILTPQPLFYSCCCEILRCYFMWCWHVETAHTES